MRKQRRKSWLVCFLSLIKNQLTRLEQEKKIKAYNFNILQNKKSRKDIVLRVCERKPTFSDKKIKKSFDYKLLKSLRITFSFALTFSGNRFKKLKSLSTKPFFLWIKNKKSTFILRSSFFLRYKRRKDPGLLFLIFSQSI